MTQFWSNFTRSAFTAGLTVFVVLTLGAWMRRRAKENGKISAILHKPDDN